MKDGLDAVFGITNIDEKSKVKKKNIVLLSIYFFIKRLIDIACSLIGCLFLLPVILLIKIIYMCSGDFNSIFYTHERIGKNEKKFKMYKFRTMYINADEMLKELLKDKRYRNEWEENFKFENDPRVTKIGGFLRKTSIDELPQIINILKNDMSLIGPRPMTRVEVDAYGKNKMKLLSVKPGLTGWWACNGRSDTTARERKKLELYYVDNCSLWLDIKILFKTVIVVLNRTGAK